MSAPEKHLVWVCCGCDNCGGKTPCDSPSADGAWVIKVDDLRDWLLSEEADGLVGRAITDERAFGGGIIATARQIRERLASALTPTPPGGSDA